MTTAYNIRKKLGLSADAKVGHLKDPGASGTIYLDGNDLALVKLATAGTQSLQAAADVGLGTRLIVLAQAAVTVNSVALDDGDYAEFVVTLNSSGARQWVQGPSTDIIANVASLISLLTGTKTVDIAIGNNWRVWDAIITNLAGADGADDLGLETGTFLTGSPTLNVTVATPSNAPFYARDPGFVVPVNYDAGTNLTLDVTVNETVAAATATVDAFVVRRNAPSVDICATAAQSIVGAANTVYSFTLTGTNVVPGEVLDIRLAITLNDGAATPEYDITKVNVDYTAG